MNLAQRIEEAALELNTARKRYQKAKSEFEFLLTNLTPQQAKSRALDDDASTDYDIVIVNPPLMTDERLVEVADQVPLNLDDFLANKEKVWTADVTAAMKISYSELKLIVNAPGSKYKLWGGWIRRKHPKSPERPAFEADVAPAPKPAPPLPPSSVPVPLPPVCAVLPIVARPPLNPVEQKIVKQMDEPKKNGHVIASDSEAAVEIGKTLIDPWTPTDLMARLDGDRTRAYAWCADWKARGWIDTVGFGQYRKTEKFGL